MMGSSKSLSLPSELPDFGNWFSSYVYESPELHTIDGLEDSADSTIAETEERPNEQNQNLNVNKNDDLPLDGKGSDIKSPARDDSNISNGLKYSNSFSLGSEPLDIGKWFSSYVYESPVLDTSDEFGSDHKENYAKCGSNEAEMTLSNSIGAGKDDSEDENIPLYGLVEDTENENTYMPKDNQKDNGTQNSTQLNYLTRHWSSDLTFLKKVMQSQGNSSANDFEVDGSSLDELSSEFKPEVSHALLNITNDPPKKEGKSAPQSVPGWDLKVQSSKGEDSTKGMDILVSAKNTEINRADAKPVKNCGNADKENSIESTENGFISTRKGRRRRADGEDSSKRSFAVKSDHVKNGTINSQCSSYGISPRKVLSEIANFQPCNKIEVTGKWKCPQKSKPNLGPPLKQLRLEQWLRRL